MHLVKPRAFSVPLEPPSTAAFMLLEHLGVWAQLVFFTELPSLFPGQTIVKGLFV